MQFSKGCTYHSIVQNVSTVFLLLTIILQVCAGYIINENGQLVPFKIYKKGGSRLHPRNCRGGFHKRLVEDPVHGGIKDLYELNVYKRQYKMEEMRKGSKPSFGLYDDDAIFDSKYGTQSTGGLSNEHNSFDTPELEENIFDIFPSLKSEYTRNDINQIRIPDTDLETLEDINEANRLLKDLSKGLEKVAEPLPLKRGSHMKAEVEEYPAYKLLDDFNTEYDVNDYSKEGVHVLPSSQNFDLYAYRRRM